MAFAVTWFAHRQVIWEGHEADPRRSDAVLHGQRDGGDAPSFYGVADQSDGPVAQGSRGREQHDVHPVFHQFAGDLGGRTLYEPGRVVDGPHKGEVAFRQLAYSTISDQATEGLEGENGIEVAALVRPVVGVSPGKVVGTGRDLTVRAIAGRVVDVEARLLGQVDASGRDERESGSFEGLLRPDEGQHSLDVEADEYGVTVFYDVVAAFETDLRLFPGLYPGTSGDYVLPISDLGGDEAALHVGVDASGCLPHSRALANGPGPALFLRRRKERDEPEHPVRRPHELLEARRLYPEHRQILCGLVFRQLDDLGFELRADPYGLSTLAAAVLLDLRAVAVTFHHRILIHVRHVERRLGCYEGAHGLGQRLRRRVDPRGTSVREMVA